MKFKRKPQDLELIGVAARIWDLSNDLVHFRLSELKLVTDFIFPLEKDPRYAALFLCNTSYERRLKIYDRFYNLQKDSKLADYGKEKCRELIKQDPLYHDFNPQMLEAKMDADWKDVEGRYYDRLCVKDGALASLFQEKSNTKDVLWFADFHTGMLHFLDFLLKNKFLNLRNPYFKLFQDIANFKSAFENNINAGLKSVSAMLATVAEEAKKVDSYKSGDKLFGDGKHLKEYQQVLEKLEEVLARLDGVRNQLDQAKESSKQMQYAKMLEA